MPKSTEQIVNIKKDEELSESESGSDDEDLYLNFDSEDSEK